MPGSGGYVHDLLVDDGLAGLVYDHLGPEEIAALQATSRLFRFGLETARPRWRGWLLQATPLLALVPHAIDEPRLYGVESSLYKTALSHRSYPPIRPSRRSRQQAREGQLSEATVRGRK